VVVAAEVMAPVLMRRVALPGVAAGRVRPGCLTAGLVPGAMTGICVVDPGLAVDPPRSNEA